MLDSWLADAVRSTRFPNETLYKFAQSTTAVFPTYCHFQVDALAVAAALNCHSCVLAATHCAGDEQPRRLLHRDVRAEFHLLVVLTSCVSCLERHDIMHYNAVTGKLRKGTLIA